MQLRRRKQYFRKTLTPGAVDPPWLQVVYRLREARASGTLRSRRKHDAGSEAAGASGGGDSGSSGASSGDGHGHGAETGQRDV